MTNMVANKPCYRIDRLDFDGNKLLVEGFFVIDNQSAEIFVKDEKGRIDPIMTLVDPKKAVRVFKYERPIDGKRALIGFFYSENGKMRPFTRCEQGKQSPFNDIPSSYYYKKGYVAAITGAMIKAQRIGWLRHLVYQEKYMRALKKKGKTDGVAKQSYRLRRLYNGLNHIYARKNICLVFDRDQEVLFGNLIQNKSNVTVFFVVDGKNQIATDLSQKSVVVFGSEEYMRNLLFSKVIVSSEFDFNNPDYVYIKDVIAKKTFISDLNQIVCKEQNK